MVIDYYNDMQELLKAVASPNHSPMFSQDNWGVNDWSGTRTFKACTDLATKGWPEGTTKIERYTSQFLNVLGSKLKIDEYFYDVTGQDFDLDRVLIGEPEAWINSEPVTVEAPALQSVKIVINLSTSIGVSEEAFIQRGAAVAALVMLLEKARRAVEVIVISPWALNMSAPRIPVFMLQMPVKLAGCDIDLSKLAFMLAHPSMLRRLLVAAAYNGSDREIAIRLDKASGGYPCEAEIEADIYIGSMFGSWNEAKSIEWIEEHLKAQGVELTEEKS